MLSSQKPPPPLERQTATQPLSSQDIPPKKDPLEGNSQMDILLRKIEELEERARPKPKKKREVSEKQREALAKAREKRNANMLQRKQIKKEMKIEEKKIVNKKLEEEKNIPIIKDDAEKPDNVLPDPETNRIINNNEVPDNYHRQPPRGNPNLTSSSVMAYQQVVNDQQPKRRMKLSERLGIKTV